MFTMKPNRLITPDLTFTNNDTEQSDGKKSVWHDEQTFNIYKKKNNIRSLYTGPRYLSLFDKKLLNYRTPLVL